MSHQAQKPRIAHRKWSQQVKRGRLSELSQTKTSSTNDSWQVQVFHIQTNQVALFYIHVI